MNHFFDVKVAEEYGVEQAIMIANFQYWITHNAANKKNFYKNKYWTYNSYKALSLIFPYWSEKQVRRILADLLEKQVLEADCFNKMDYDKTKWYAFINEARWLNMPIPGARSDTPPVHIEMGTARTGTPPANSGTGSADTGRPIPLPNTNDKQNKKHKHKSQDVPDGTLVDDSGGNGQSINEPPVAPAPLEIKGLYQQMNDTYNNWCITTTGVGGVFGKAQGEAMKKIIAYLGAQVKRGAETKTILVTEEYLRLNIIASFNFILVAMAQKKVEAFLCNQIKLTQIESNLLNIINQLKNGSGKKQQTGETVATETISNQFKERFAG